MFRRLMGKKIADRRKALRWSQEALAHEAGWSRQQLSRVELGTSSIATDRLLSLAEVLECEVADLLPSKAEVDPGEKRLLKSTIASIAQRIQESAPEGEIFVFKEEDHSLTVTVKRANETITIEIEEDLGTFLRDYENHEIAELVKGAMRP